VGRKLTVVLDRPMRKRCEFLAVRKVHRPTAPSLPHPVSRSGSAKQRWPTAARSSPSGISPRGSPFPAPGYAECSRTSRQRDWCIAPGVAGAPAGTTTPRLAPAHCSDSASSRGLPKDRGGASTGRPLFATFLPPISLSPLTSPLSLFPSPPLSHAIPFSIHTCPPSSTRRATP
jgi:hypothetical protein